MRALLPAIVLASIAVAGCGESHPAADPALAPLADRARIVVQHNDCSDLTDIAYIKNNICIDYMLIQAPTHESAQAFLLDEAAALDRDRWRAFPVSDFGFRRPVIGRTDRSGHDCLVVGPPARIPLSMEDPNALPVARFWSTIREKLAEAQRLSGPIIGLQFYPGPANEPNHRAC